MMDDTRLSEITKRWCTPPLGTYPREEALGAVYEIRELLAHIRALSAALAHETSNAMRMLECKREAEAEADRLEAALAQAEAEREALRDLIAAELREFPETSSRRLREALPTPAPPSPAAGEEVPS